MHLIFGANDGKINIFDFITVPIVKWWTIDTQINSPISFIVKNPINYNIFALSKSGIISLY